MTPITAKIIIPPQAWEEFEEAFNNVEKELFISTHNEFKIRITVDDEKHWFNHFVNPRDMPLDENSELKRERPGRTADVACYTSSGVPIFVYYRRKGKSEQTGMIAALEKLFMVGEGNDTANLSGKIQFTADRGYWRPGLLKFLLSLGCDILGTIMRQIFFPWTYGIKEPSTPPKEDDPTFIPVNVLLVSSKKYCVIILARKTTRISFKPPWPSEMATVLPLQ